MAGTCPVSVDTKNNPSSSWLWSLWETGGFSKWLLETRSVFRRHGRIHSQMNHAATRLSKNRASACTGLIPPFVVCRRWRL